MNKSESMNDGYGFEKKQNGLSNHSHHFQQKFINLEKKLPAPVSIDGENPVRQMCHIVVVTPRPWVQSLSHPHWLLAATRDRKTAADPNRHMSKSWVEVSSKNRE
jgi:hypothetical protein